MTKKVSVGVAVFIVVMLISFLLLRTYTKTHSPQETATFANTDIKVEVTYSRPYKKGRLIFGDEKENALVPYNKKWRTGANEATEISFSRKVTIDDKELPAGRYSMYTIPGPDSWTIVFNRELDYWGINPMGETFNEEADVLRASAEVTQVPTEVEQFTILFDQQEGGNVELLLRWDKTSVVLPIVVKK